MTFFAVLLLVTGTIHAYLWLRLIGEPAWPSPYRELGTWALIALGSSIPLGAFFRRTLPRKIATVLSRCAYLWIGVMFYLFVLLIPSEIYRLGKMMISAFAGFPFRPAEQVAFARVSSMIALFGTMACVIGGMISARHLRVKHVPVFLSKLGESFAGFRIAQLSDVHVGPNVGRAFVETMVKKTNALRPDVVVITGDLVDGSVHSLAPEVAPLAALEARHRVYFVTGNHEYYSGAPGWVEHLATLGIRVLCNQHVRIEENGDSLTLAGVNDWTAGSFIHEHAPNIPAALENRDPESPVILLAHQPKAVNEAAAHGVDLVLSGHTHGGQLVPFDFIVRLTQPFIAGLYRVRDTQLYVSRGTGYWGPPMRVGAPPEITLIELQPGARELGRPRP